MESMQNNGSGNAQWEAAFLGLNKRLFSADVLGGYNLEGLLQRHQAEPDSKILDFGCGKGAMVRNLRARGYNHVFGVDPSAFLLNQNDQHLPEYLQHMEPGKIPFPDQSMDLIYASGVLHHIEFDQLPAVVEDIVRVLKIGGRFIYLEPRKSWLRSLGHVAVLSPLAQISKSAMTLAECLRAEWPTYSVWLERDKEFSAMCAVHGLKSLEQSRRLMTSTGAFLREF